MTTLKERYRARHDLLQEHLRSGSELSDPRVLYDVLFGVEPEMPDVEDGESDVSDSAPSSSDVLAPTSDVPVPAPPTSVKPVSATSAASPTGEKPIIWDPSDKRFFYDGKGYVLNVMDGELYMTLTPKNDALGGVLRDRWNQAKSDKIKLAALSSTCLGVNECTELTFETSNTANMNDVLAFFKTVQDDKAHTIRFDGGQFKYGGASYTIEVMSDHVMRVTPDGREFVDLLIDEWNSMEPEESKIQVLSASVRCGFGQNCTEIAFARNLTLGWKTYKHTKIIDVLGSMQRFYDPRTSRGTHDDLYSRFNATMTTTPTDTTPTDSLYARFGDMSKQFDSLHHTTPPPRTYHGGIGPLGNVFAEM